MKKVTTKQKLHSISQAARKAHRRSTHYIRAWRYSDEVKAAKAKAKAERDLLRSLYR